MKRFEIGPGVTCDLDRLVDTRLLVQANSGGGKSWLLRRLLEQTHGHVQHLVIDPEGEFASLRERFDYVLAAKSGGDTAADPRSAALLAERLLELKVSAILDIYELKPHERILFVRRFLEALIDAPKALWHPALVVVDEAHVYCPQVGEAESAGAVKDLATRGRKRGFCAVLASQRLSKLHKDAAAECNNKLIGRTSLDVDMKRAAHELGLTSKEQIFQLRDRRAGEFYVFGPAFVDVVGIASVRVGPVETTHPKAGARLAFTAPPPTSKITALLPKLADLPAEQEERIKSVDTLKKENANLRRELTIAQRAQPPAPKAETKTVEKFVLKDGQLARAEKLIDRAERLSETFGHLVSIPLSKILEDVAGVEEGFRTTAKAIRDAIAQTRAPQPHIPPAATRREPLTPSKAMGGSRPVSSPARPAREAHDAGDRLPPGEYATLTAALQYNGLDRKRLSVLTGYKRSSRDAYIARLVAKGLVDVQGQSLFATDAGRAALNGSFEPLPTGADLIEYWLQRLPEGERKSLNVLIEANGQDVERERIDTATGYKRSSRDAYLTRLKARGLVEFSGRGMVRASAELFS